VGAVGFILLSLFFLIALLLPFVRLIKDRDVAGLALFSGFAAILVQYLSMSTIYIIYIWVFLAVYSVYASKTSKE
jgi:hypothetical protein